jgi:hypothetical protein
MLSGVILQIRFGSTNDVNSPAQDIGRSADMERDAESDRDPLGSDLDPLHVAQWKEEPKHTGHISQP